MKSTRIFLRLFAVLLAVLLAGVSSFDAEAKRLGGGGSFGRQSSNVTQRQATPPAAPAQPSNATGRSAGTSAAAGGAARKPWTGVLGGLAAGLGLAWLANALGLGPAFANLLLVGLLVLVVLAVVGMLKRPRAAGVPGAQGVGAVAYQGAGAGQPIVTPPQYNPTKVGNDASARPWESSQAGVLGGSIIGSALGGAQGWGIPADFDIAGFTEAAKRNFITLQKAWDQGDIPTLRAMMTNDMLEQIRAQLAEREREAPGVANETEVAVLEAQLLGIEELDDLYMASVEFSGMIREDASAGPSPFREVWNMTRPRSGRGGWLVAGVQALQ